jgi:DNA-binding transcriptional regulator YdaS (Cro superfamily)
MARYENPAVRRAIDHAGSIYRLAHRLGIRSCDVETLLAAEWVSPDVAVRIAVATDHAVTLSDLRPDLFVHPSREPPLEWKGPLSPVQPASCRPPPQDVSDATQSGAGRVLRVARVEFDGPRTRVWLSDGSELGGIGHASVSQYAGGASVALGLNLPVAAKEVV